MARRRKLETELSELRAELSGAPARPAQPDTAAPAASAPPPEPPPRSTSEPEPTRDDGAVDLEGKIEELRQALSDYVDSAEDLASNHPLALAGAAFLLGVVVGRVTKRD
jgi:hypothetical protein